MTAHGLWAMTATLLSESGKWHPDAIERALAHGDTDKVSAAYTRGAYWQDGAIVGRPSRHAAQGRGRCADQSGEGKSEMTGAAANVLSFAVKRRWTVVVESEWLL